MDPCLSQIFAGAHDLRQIGFSDAIQEGSIAKIVEVVLRNGTRVDIAILKLDQPLQMTPYVQTVALAPKGFNPRRKLLFSCLQLP